MNLLSDRLLYGLEEGGEDGGGEARVVALQPSAHGAHPTDRYI